MDDLVNSVCWCSRCGCIVGDSQETCPNCGCRFSHTAPGSEEDFARAHDCSRQQEERVEHLAAPLRGLLWLAAVIVLVVALWILLRT